MLSKPLSRAPEISHRVPQLCAGTAAGIAFLALLGWVSGARFLAGELSTYIPMAPSTALAFLLLSGALFGRAHLPVSRPGRFFELAAVSIVLLIGLLILAQFIFGIDLGIERVLSRTNELLGSTPLGRMSPLSAIAFLLEGAALLMILIGERRRNVPTAIVLLATVAIAIHTVVLIGYVFGAPLLYGGTSIPVALPTAIAFVLVGLGQFNLAAPDVPALREWSGASMRGNLLRAFLPFLLVFILLDSWADLTFAPMMKLNPAVWYSLKVLAAGALIVITIAWIARRTGGEIERAQKALAESEERYRSLFENMPSGYAHCQMLFEDGKPQDFIYLDVNDAFEELTGLKDVAGKKVSEVIRGIQESNPELFETYGRVSLTGKSERFETHIEALGIWFSMSIYSPKQGYFVAIFDNITERKQAEEALRDSETRYRLATHATNDVIWEWDSKTKQLTWTVNAQLVFGYPPGEIGPNETWWDNHVHPEDRQRAISELNALMAGTETIWSSEYRFLLKDGSYAYISDHAYIERDASGNAVRMIGAMSNVTERKRAEEALAASESRYRRLFESNPHPMWVYDLETLRFLAVNDAAMEHYGYSQDEFRSMTIKEIRPAEDIPKLMANLGEFQQDLHAPTVWRHQKKDGTLIDVEITSHSVQWQERPARLALATDITERKRAEEALLQSEEQYRSLFEDSPISLWLEDFSGVKQRLDELKKIGVQDIQAYLREHPEFVSESAKQVRILDVNSAALKIFHARHKSELLGNLADILPAPALEYFEHELIQIANGRLNFEWEEVDHTLTGEEIHVNIRWSVAPGYEDSLAKVIVSTIDITERKQAQEALQENERLLSEAQHIGRIGSWSYDIPADTLKFSDEMYRLFDVSPQEFRHNAEGFLGLIYSPDRPMAAQWMEGIRRGRQAEELEFLIFRKNSELRYIRCRGALKFDKTGKPAQFIGTAQDVTERKLSEIQIRQHIERLTALRKIDQAITSSFNLNVTLDLLLSQVISQLQVDAADILLLIPEERLLEYAAGKGFHTHAIEHARVRLDDSQAGRAVRERRTIQIENLENKPDERLSTPLGSREGFVCYFAVPLIVKRKVMGVLEIFHRAPLQPYPEWLEFLDALGGQAAIAIDNATLFENLQRSNSELSRAYDATIEGWSRALDLRDKETEGHTLRVTEITLKLAHAFGLPEEELVHIRRGALLHDIGKMGVPDNILLKPGELTEEEWVRMRSHPQYAYDLLKPITFLARALDIPYCHHEKWNGTGYPRGLKGEEIPLVARLFAVVDVWDAIRSDRPYRSAWSVEKSREHIREQAGIYFEPKVVDVFLELIKE